MIHRHLQIPPGTRANELPAAAIVDILDRGDLADWRPLAAAIAKDPHGKLAERAMRLIDTNSMYGTSPLWRAWIHRCRTRAEGVDGSSRSASLSALRRELGLTQVELAHRIGISQSDVSKLERRRDVRLSTLEAYSKALGGTLRILFETGHHRVRVRLQDRDD